MNKKILIGSIIAVSVLIGVSFTSVVGYRSVEFDVKVSPLFAIRTQKAINEESNSLTCNYVGKGRPTLINIQKRDNRTVLLQRFIERINKIDDMTLNRFINFIIKQLHQANTITDENIPKLVITLYQIKSNPENIKNELEDITDKFPTQEGFWCTSLEGEWYPGCIIWGAFVYIITIIGLLLVLIGSKFTWFMC